MTPEQLNNLYKSPDAIRNIGNNPITNALNNSVNSPQSTPNPVQQSKPSNAAYYKYADFAAQQEATNFARRTPVYTTPPQPTASAARIPTGVPPTDITNAGKIGGIANWLGVIGVASQGAAIANDMQQNPNSYNGKDIVGTAGSVANLLRPTANQFLYTNPLYNVINQLDNIWKAEKAKSAQLQPNPATTAENAPPPFTGGQGVGITYKVTLRFTNNFGVNIQPVYNVLGAVIGISGNTLFYNGGSTTVTNGSNGVNNLRFVSIVRLDGLPDTGGDPLGAVISPSISATPPQYTTASADYLPTINDDPAYSPPPPVPSTPTVPREQTKEGDNGLPQGLFDPALTNGLGLGRTTTNTPPSVEFPQGFNANTDTFEGSVWRRYPSADALKLDDKTQTPQKKEEQDKKNGVVPLSTPTAYTTPTTNPTTNPTTPTSPTPTETPSKEELEQAKQFREDVKNDLAQLKLEQLQQKTLLDALPLAAVTAFIASNPAANWVKSNTKQAAKEAVCEESTPDQCIYNAVNNATTPLSNKLDAAQIARDTNAAAQTTALANILAKIAEMFDWMKTAFSNTVVDKVVSYLTLITTLHNASMLSRDLGATLTGVFDNALNIAGLQVKNPEGQVITVSTIIGNTFTNFVKGVIGTANYTAFTETWTKANRIYQSAINVVDITRSLFDSARSLNELTGNNLGKIGNALKKDGVVSENAYHHMSENNTQFNVYMEKLEQASNAVSTLSSISGEILNIQENVTQLQVSRTAFNNAIKDAEPKVIEDNVPVKTDSDTKKAASIYTIGDFSITKEPDPETP